MLASRGFLVVFIGAVCMRVCLYVEKGRERERRAIQGVLKGFCGGCSMVALRSLPT